ncbi:MAG TPA: alpha/beta fold hydrolase, partial [Stenomitos sp.]
MKEAAVGMLLGMMAMAGPADAQGGAPVFERAPVGKSWIAYEDTKGNGPAVLCMPGMGDVRGEYRYLVPLLQKAGYRVLVADLRGHGDSSTDFASYTPADSGDDVLAVLDHAGVSRATLIGCSMSGGSIAWAAAKAPERVEALVMLAPFAR